jgi:hypothetical protein
MKPYLPLLAAFTSLCVADLVKIAGRRGDPLQQEAKGMLKLIKQSERLGDKIRQKGGAK